MPAFTGRGTEINPAQATGSHHSVCGKKLENLEETTEKHANSR